MKRTFKALAHTAAFVAVLPAYLVFRLTTAVIGQTRTFPGWSQAFSLIPGFTGIYLRRAFYRLVFAYVGPDACLSFGTTFSHATSRVGKSVYVGLYCCLGDVTLEDDVLLGSHVSIMNGGGQHGIDRLDIPVREQPGVWPHVTIGRDTWIGDRAIILASVGRHCVVGAGSVVTQPLPDYAIAVGVPAKIVRYRNGSDVERTATPAAPEPKAGLSAKVCRSS